MLSYFKDFYLKGLSKKVMFVAFGSTLFLQGCAGNFLSGANTSRDLVTGEVRQPSAPSFEALDQANVGAVANVNQGEGDSKELVGGGGLLPSDQRDRDWVASLIRSDLQRNGYAGSKKHEREKIPPRLDDLKVSFEDDSDVWRPHLPYDIPVVENEKVQNWVRIFTTTLRPKFSLWLSRSSRYAPLIEKVLAENDLPHDLIYLSLIESGFNLNAYSRAKATGPWQFMPATGRMYGLQSGGYVDERRDIEKSTRAAAAHLKDLYSLYNDWYLAFAAYNAGAGGVNRAIKKSGTTDFWRMTAGKSRYLHAETKDYVPRILAAAIIAKNYKKYGFAETAFMEPMKYQKVEVADATDLSAIANCAGVSIEQIDELNPALVMGMTPPGQTYSVYVPDGTADLFKENYAKLPKDQRVKLVRHKVRPHETLVAIAKRYGVSSVDLAQANGLSTKSRLKGGMFLMIPKNNSKTDSSVVARNASQESSSVISEGGTARKIYTVRSGDTLGKIASRSGVSVASLIKANPGLNATRLKLAQKITIPSSSVSAPSAVASAKNSPVQSASSKKIVYSVRVGESLWDVARKHKVTVNDLKKWNKLVGTRLRPNQKLVVYPQDKPVKDLALGAVQH